MTKKRRCFLHLQHSDTKTRVEETTMALTIGIRRDSKWILNGCCLDVGQALKAADRSFFPWECSLLFSFYVGHLAKQTFPFGRRPPRVASKFNLRPSAGRGKNLYLGVSSKTTTRATPTPRRRGRGRLTAAAKGDWPHIKCTKAKE